MRKGERSQAQAGGRQFIARLEGNEVDLRSTGPGARLDGFIEDVGETCTQFIGMFSRHVHR